MAKTNKKDFALFVEECEKWITAFGLIGWEIDYEHKQLPGSRAEIHVGKLTDRIATILLCKDWGKFHPTITDNDIKKVAFHEITELFLTRMVAIAGARYISEEEIEEEKHNLIHTLENVLFGNLEIE